MLVVVPHAYQAIPQALCRTTGTTTLDPSARNDSTNIIADTTGTTTLNLSVPSDFTSSIAGNRHYRGSTAVFLSWKGNVEVQL